MREKKGGAGVITGEHTVFYDWSGWILADRLTRDARLAMASSSKYAMAQATFDDSGVLTAIRVTQGDKQLPLPPVLVDVQSRMAAAANSGAGAGAAKPKPDKS